MNKIVMVIWGLVIVGLCTLIFMIGYNKQDRDYINYVSELKKAGKSYVNDNRISIKVGDSIIIYIDDLIKNQYIKEDKKIEEYCIEGIVYSNELLIDNYSIKKNCEDKKTE